IRDFHVTGVQTCALPICGSNSPGRLRTNASAGRRTADGPHHRRGGMSFWSYKPPLWHAKCTMERAETSLPNGRDATLSAQPQERDRKSGVEGNDGDPVRL